MRWRLLFVLSMACGFATPADSNPHGRDLWQVRLGSGINGRWVLLDAGRLRARERWIPVVLLGLAREDRPSGRYSEMKVVDGRSGSVLWTYDGTGSDYVIAGGKGTPADGEAFSLLSTRPQLRDVDGDDSDDVVFMEQDFILGTLLRAVRIEP